jgi:hypothetical protein
MASLRTALSRRQLQSEHALQQHGLRESETSTCADEAGKNVRSDDLPAAIGGEGGPDVQEAPRAV